MGSGCSRTFVAATVYGGDGKVFPGGPGTDRSIYAFCPLYALDQYIVRIGCVYRVAIGAVEDIHRSILLVVVGGGLPTDFPISFGQFLNLEPSGNAGWHIVYPWHGGLQGGSSVVMLFKDIIKPLRIVHEVLRAIVPFACQAMCTGEVYLPFHFIHCPVAFTGIEEIDAQSGNNLPTVALLLPVDTKAFSSREKIRAANMYG